jgi:hypothetical protein
MTTTETQPMTGAPLARHFSTYENSYQTSVHDVVFAQAIANDHRTLQQKATATLLTAIVAMADNADQGYTDGRNEASAAICQKIRDLLVNEGVYIDVDGAVRFPFI